MKTLAVLSAHTINDYAFKPFQDNGLTAFDSALARAVQLPDCAKLIITAQDSQQDVIKQHCEQAALKSIEIVPVQGTETLDFLKTVEPFVRTVDHVFFCWADAPFLDVQAAVQLYTQHCKYHAEYSFADGYPEGLIPQLTEAGLLPLLANLPHAAEIPFTRSFLFDLIKKDINSYDLETMIAPDDMRSFRLRFYAETKVSWMICSRFTDITAENYAVCIKKNEEFLRPLPAYYGIEITDYHPLQSLYRPALFKNTFSPEMCMDFKRITALIDSIAAFSETAVICLSLYGEPLLHPDIAAITAHILSYPSLSVLIETSGLAGNTALYTAIAAEQEKASLRKNGMLPVYWIVGIDAVGSKIYGAVHGLSDDKANAALKQAVTAADELARLFPKAVWSQMVRMNENEAELEPFYRFWEKQTGQPLIQKYDHLCGKLPDRRTADISPLQRYPCWHLKRDMAILNDGTVPLCKEDCERTIILGNVFTDSLETVWENGLQYYRNHIKSVYNGLCGRCDEYYTYNF